VTDTTTAVVHSNSCNALRDNAKWIDNVCVEEVEIRNTILWLDDRTGGQFHHSMEDYCPFGLRLYGYSNTGHCNDQSSDSPLAKTLITLLKHYSQQKIDILTHKTQLFQSLFATWVDICRYLTKHGGVIYTPSVDTIEGFVQLFGPHLVSRWRDTVPQQMEVSAPILPNDISYVLLLLFIIIYYYLLSYTYQQHTHFRGTKLKKKKNRKRQDMEETNKVKQEEETKGMNIKEESIDNCSLSTTAATTYLQPPMKRQRLEADVKTMMLKKGEEKTMEKWKRERVDCEMRLSKPSDAQTRHTYFRYFLLPFLHDDPLHNICSDVWSYSGVMEDAVTECH
ncbi:hypothetical protein RFI_27287, partial [Reticulomyxa filosa]